MESTEQIINEQNKKDKKMIKNDLYRALKLSLQSVHKSCDDPITENSFFCWDCQVSSCPKCSLKEHRTHNTTCKFPYYKVDTQFIEKHFEVLEEFLNNNPDILNTDKIKQELQNLIIDELDDLIQQLSKIKEIKLKEIDKVFSLGGFSMDIIKKCGIQIRKNLFEFFLCQKSFFNIDQRSNRPLEEEQFFYKENTNTISAVNAGVPTTMTIPNPTISNYGLEKEKYLINRDYGSVSFLLSHDLLNSTQEKNKEIKSQIQSITSACSQYSENFKQKTLPIKNQIQKLLEASELNWSLQELNKYIYKDIEDKIIKYSEKINEIKNYVFDEVNKTGHLGEIDKKNYEYEAKRTQNIDNILSSQSIDINVDSTITTNDFNKTLQSKKVRHIDFSKKCQSTITTEGKGIMMERPKITLSSPSEVTLNSDTLQKYFAQIMFEFLSEGHKKKKEGTKTVEKIEMVEELDEDIEVAKPITGSKEIQVYDRTGRRMIKRKVQFDKSRYRYNGFLTGNRSIVIKDRVYITGGVDKEQNQTKIALMYNLKTNTMIQLPDMINPHAYHSIEFLDYYKSILIVGGENNPYCDLFDITSGKWISLPELNFSRANPSLFLEKNTHMLYCCFGIVGNIINKENNYCDYVECLELKNIRLGWGKLDYKNNTEMNFKNSLCKIFPIDQDKLLIYGASGVRDNKKKAVIYLINKNEMVKIDHKLFNEMRMQAKKSKKLTKIISSFLNSSNNF